MTMNKRDPRTYMHFFSMILKTNEEMLLNVTLLHLFFFILGINVLLIIIWFEETVKVRK